jgi:phage terminase small subunit
MDSPDETRDPDAQGDTPAPAPRLSPRQRRFAEEYICDLNATEAAKRAGYSAHTASEIGYALKNKPQVAALIEQLTAERSARLRVTADRVLEELATIAYSDIRHYGVSRKGLLLRTAGAPHEASRAVMSVKRKSEGFDHTVELKLYDKVRALELLGKHLKMFVDQVDHTSGGLPVTFTLAIGEKRDHAIG